MKLNQRRGFTLIEIIVSISIFVILLSLVLSIFYSSRYREKNSEKGLRYYLLASKLNYYLKNDLRAVYRSKIGKIRGEERYSMYVSYETDSGEVKRKPITYKFDSINKKVERIDEELNKSIFFDFYDTLKKEDDFKFSIFAKDIEGEYETMHEFASSAKITW
ncbi:MAG: hypothetical protein COB02_13360 [Candidatus Cloacimonadota bacterium]|nr:MAG: hypothetical protein COB02_13360 [Candidatus Cloacimonadota bacterium]